MNKQSAIDPAELREHIRKAMRQSFKNAVLIHRVAGVPLVMTEGDKVVYVDPNEVDIGPVLLAKEGCNLTDVNDRLHITKAS